MPDNPFGMSDTELDEVMQNSRPSEPKQKNDSSDEYMKGFGCVFALVTASLLCLYFLFTGRLGTALVSMIPGFILGGILGSIVGSSVDSAKAARKKTKQDKIDKCTTKGL